MSKLFNIEKVFIDIANKNSNDIPKLKGNIDAYFKNIDEIDLESIKKKDKYFINYENKRNVDKIKYEKYLTEKSILKTIFQNEKTKISLYNYLKLKCPIKNNIPDLYTYENIELKDRVIIPRSPVAKVNKINKNKKVPICPEGKEINPVTGRCVKVCEDGKVRDPITGTCKTIKIEKVAKIKKVVTPDVNVVVPNIVKPDDTIVKKIKKVVKPDDPDDEIKPDDPIVKKIKKVVKPDDPDDEIKPDDPIVKKIKKVVKPDDPDDEIKPDDPIVKKIKKVVKPDDPDDEIKPDDPIVDTDVKVVNIKNTKCPEGKEINPITGRCVKKCEDGKVRDPKTGICKKVKVDKLANIDDIKCPEGKEVNPLTGRIVNKCKEGEERDLQTGKCKKKLKK